MSKVYRFRAVTWLRRFTLTFVFLTLILSPILQILRTLRQDPYPYPNSPVIKSSVIRELLLKSDHKVRNNIDFFYESLSGGPQTLKVGPMTFSEPLSITTNAIRRLDSLSTWNMTMLVSLFFSLTLAFLFGRVFCGYICPMSAITSINQKLQQKHLKRFFRISGTLNRRMNSKKQLFFTIVLFALVCTHPLFLQYLLPPSLFQNAVSDIILFGGLTLWVTLVFILLFYELLRPGHFCRRLCPTGTFLSIVGQKKYFHLQHVKDTRCPKGCSSCLDVCWLGLNPKSKIKNSACDLCTRCAKACPTSRIKFMGFIIPLLLLFSPPISEASIFDQNELNVEQTLFEGEQTEILPSGAKFTFYYSIVGFDKFAKIGGDLDFYLHIKKNDKIFSEPIVITQLFNNSILKKKTLNEVGHPISIGKRSLYKITFHFSPKTPYKFIITAKNNQFSPIEVIFSYPQRRF